MDIETPAALIDRRRMAGNIARMQDHLSALGVRLRPHVKTSKCIEVARAQQEAGAVGITVSTLKEAEQFFAAGFIDVLYAVCIAPDKLDRALALIRKGCALTLLVDSVAAAEAVVAKGKAANQKFDVMIEIDSDGHRSGVQPEAPELIDIGQVLQAGGATVKGVLTHAGSSYDLDTPEALQALAEQERGMSPGQVIKKRHGIFIHQSQKDSVPFQGSDSREFWQRAEERNANTASLFAALGMTKYAAVEAFVRWEF